MTIYDTVSGMSFTQIKEKDEVDSHLIMFN